MKTDNSVKSPDEVCAAKSSAPAASTKKKKKSMIKSIAKGMSFKKKKKFVDDDTVVGVNVASNGPSTPVSAAKSSAPATASKPTIRAVLLLMDPNSRKFELIQLEFDSTIALVADVLHQAQSYQSATRNLKYEGVCNQNGHEMISSLNLSIYCKGNEIVTIAIPEGMDGNETLQLAQPILSDSKVIDMLPPHGVKIKWASEPVKKMDKITEEDGKEKQKVGTTSKKEDASSNASAVIGTGALLSDEVCASCGIAAVDNIELKDCDGGCDLVKYCSDDCQNNNWEQHEEACKKRVEELRDVDLLTQPKSSHLGDCPICLLPLSIDPTKSMLATCCCKIVCKGCEYANHKREIEAGLVRRCAFCREPAPKSEEEANKRIMKRVKKNDPVAMWKMGKERWDVGDYESALEYYKKGADLGDAYAHYYLSLLYKEGQGVEKDKEKYIYHSEEAAIGGHPMARHNLGIEDWNAGRYVKSVKHFIIAASLGYHDSLKSLMTRCAKGLVPKELYAAALRAYQATVDAAKSLERDETEAAHEEQMKLLRQLDESGIDWRGIDWPGASSQGV